MKAKHYYRFETEIESKMRSNSLSKYNWDILRVDERDSPFSIENDKESYERSCRNSVSYKNVAQEIINLVKKNDLVCEKIISLGVGKGVLEWHLKNLLPEVSVECTDWAEQAIDKLKKVFAADDIYTFDMLNGDYTKLENKAIFVMYRVSTEFDSKSWCKIFKKMHKANIEHIIFIPTGLETLKSMMQENINHVKNIICGRKDFFCGWLYSEREFLKMFRGKNQSLYRVIEKADVGDTAIYLLKRN